VRLAVTVSEKSEARASLFLSRIKINKIYRRQFARFFHFIRRQRQLSETIRDNLLFWRLSRIAVDGRFLEMPEFSFEIMRVILRQSPRHDLNGLKHKIRKRMF
jgi:hypothetical protein